MNGKYVNYEFIMDGIAKYGFAPHLLDEHDVLEDIFDALSLMGAPEMAIRRTKEITISDYRGELPVDLYDLIPGGVLHKLTGIPLTHHSNIYPAGSVETVGEMTVTDTDSLDQDTPTLTTTNVMGGEPTYFVENGYIRTGFETGEVVMTYMAFPTDERGYPMVPDMTRVIKGVTAYCARQIAFQLYMQDKLDEKKFAYLDQECNFRIGSGSTAQRNPSHDKMNNLVNLWVSPVINPFGHAGRYGQSAYRPRFKTHTRK